MANDEIPQYAELFKQLFMFQGLNTAQIAHLVTRFKPITFDVDQLVFTEGSEGDRFYIIFRGKVKVTRADKEGEQFLGVLGIGEYFGEESLLFARPRSASVTTLEPTTLLYLDIVSFTEMLEDFPQTRALLTVTAESRHVAQRENFDWLGEDEVIYILRRKHELFLLTSLLLPIFIGLISIPLLAYGISSLNSSFTYNLAAFFGILGIATAIIWLIWRWIDWGNDFYIVTNQRVLRLEKVVLLYNSRREAPLTQILAVNVAKTWFGRMLGYGDVEVRTFTGGIGMHRTSNPNLFAAYVDGIKLRAGYFGKQAEREAIRQALRERLGLSVDNGSMMPGLSNPTFRRRTQEQPKPGSLRYFLNTLFVVRYEEENVITYRKHWLLLFRKTWIPTLLLMLLLVWVGIQIRNNYSGQLNLFSSSPMFVIYALLFLVFIGWWAYGYVDWSNDIYQLAPDQIRDIERKPLGDEMKKTAPLESILSLEHSRDGIIQLVFNYGYVVINVGETRFIFRGVYNPDQVHQDVSDYIEALKRRKEEVVAARERERMLNWLTVYKGQVELMELLEREADWDIFPG